MFKITNGRLDPASLARLAKFQEPVNQQDRYIDQVEMAQAQWKTRRNDPVFESVTDELSIMGWPGGYCHYCCGSEAGHIDHYQPKNLYPRLTFVWSNFIHSCERCNTRHKKDQCAVIVGEAEPLFVDLTRQRRADVRRPRAGRIALINPRREDPMELLRLDIGANGTFAFEPTHAPGTIEWYRADYTRRVLGLNTRAYLIRERRGAYEAIVRFLKAYDRAATNGDAAKKRRMLRNIREISHQSVWQELVRSHHRVPEVAGIFANCPELIRRRL